jgi:ABC-type multidrug transport system fused ATPase/permease subunit
MEIVKYLISQFVNEYLFEVVLLIILGLAGSIITTNVITHFNSMLITSVQGGQLDTTIMFFKYFMYSRIAYALFTYGYKLVQDVIMTNLKQWIRNNLIKIILKTSNEDLSNINFTKLNTPINRLASTVFLILGDTLNFSLPYAMFILVSIGYFMYQHFEIGMLFLIGNILWMLVLYYIWPYLRYKNIKYENDSMIIEKHLVENLNNIDKIITRGKIDSELESFNKEKEVTIQSHRDYYYSVSTVKFAIEMITLLTMFVCAGYTIHLVFENKISIIQFISILTLLFVFKERMNSSAALVSDAIEQYGRLEAIVEWFRPFEDKLDMLNAKYNKNDISFDHIEFKNVSFQYNKNTEKIFDKTNIDIYTNNGKIIGIIGNSGKGKSTFTKLMLKLYKVDEGQILIDGKNIDELDPDYIRENIVYINQNARLFDKTVLENVLYGCKDEDTCKQHHEHIMSYPKIKELYENIDLSNDTAGYSGEKLSGGQRQIVNIISGLVNPCKILILDEPTNALDNKLKMELLEIIKYFKQYKQCIIIITHDKDVYDIFNEELKL